MRLIPASARWILCGFALHATTTLLPAQTYGTGQTATGTITVTNLNDLTFNSNASAGSAVITNDDFVRFYDTSSASAATITNNYQVFFLDSSDAGTSTFINNGSVSFNNTSTADSGTFINGPGGDLDASPHSGHVSLGSITGVGTLHLGANAVTVGTLNTSTTFAGMISDGGTHGDPGGSLIKAGTGTLTLTGVNTYTGGTTISAGTLLANTQTINPAVGRPYSSTGSGAVTILNGAALGGTGVIDGLVTVQSGGALTFGHTGASLALEGGLTLQTGASLNYVLGTASDVLVVDNGLLTGPSGTGGVTINFTDGGGFAPGTYTLATFYTDDGTTTSDWNLSDLALGSTIAGYNYSLAFHGNVLDLTATAIPEPATYAALLGAGALGLAAWRRRRRPAGTGVGHKFPG